MRLGSSTAASAGRASRAWPRSSAPRRSGASSTAACRSWAGLASPTTQSSRGYGAKSAPSAFMTAPPRCIAGRSPAAYCGPAECRILTPSLSPLTSGERLRSARRRALPGRRGCPELLEQGIADRVEIETMRGDKGARLDDDVVDVADQLEPLVKILAVEAQPLAEDLHEVDDLEAAPVADIAKLAVASVVDRRQCRHPGIGDRGELTLDELALEGRQHREAVGLGPDARHIDLDKLDAGDDREQLAHRRLYRWQYRPLVQRHSFFDARCHQLRERVGTVGEKHQKRVQIERPGAKALLIARQRRLADLHLAARAPGQYSRGAGRGEPVDRRVADLRGILKIPLAELVDAAALPWPAHDLIVDAETVERVEA